MLGQSREETNWNNESRVPIQNSSQGNIYGEKGWPLCAAPPPMPLEARKALFSIALTKGIGYNRGNTERGMKLAFIDVRRPYFHAKVRRDVYVAPPAEDAEEGKSGLLQQSWMMVINVWGHVMQRRARWYRYTEFMKQAGFNSIV